MRLFASKILKALKVTIIGFVLFSIGIVLLYRFIPISHTPLMLIRSLQQPTSQHNVIQKQWKSLQHISPHLVTAVIAAEDQRFLTHYGFDINAIKAAFVHNSKNTRRPIKGASTISQQTAKNVFLWPYRDWVRKGLEAYFTLLIELLWNKERIIEVYLNVIELGNGIYGAEAAAQLYFHKSAIHLTRYEAASLAAILPNPLKSNPVKPSYYTQQRIQWIQRQMRNIGTILLYKKN
jgi:monofunctional biosynthetic peptidoglycan transglycosylase